MPKEKTPKGPRADINIYCSPEERAVIIQAAQIMGYTRTPTSTHGYSTFCRDCLMNYSREVVAGNKKGARRKKA